MVRTERPPWAERLRAERAARDWSQADAVRALRAHSPDPLPDEPTLLRNWKRWEAGTTYPDDFYRPLIAKTLGTVTTAIFPQEGRRNGDAEILAATGNDTLEIISKLRASRVDTATLDALWITVDRLCSEYPHMSPMTLRTEGQQWLRRIENVLDGRLTLAQHRDVLALAGWLALLVGCVEHDIGDRRSAEATRRAGFSLGTEAEHGEVVAWAYEMGAWFALTQGDYRGVIAASEAGAEAAPRSGVSVQLAAQAAKAWARIGDRRKAEVALDRGRNLLEALPYPENLDHHFVVDPTKFDFYVMDVYRVLGENRLAETYAGEVIRAGTGFDGHERSPMRNAEAQVTLGVVAARRGDLEQAVSYGEKALEGPRKSLPSLVMASRELGNILHNDHAHEPAARNYLEHLRALTSSGKKDSGVSSAQGPLRSPGVT
jgi:tetratricopeptide (TPR) repeat protein